MGASPSGPVRNELIITPINWNGADSGYSELFFLERNTIARVERMLRPADQEARCSIHPDM
jgi:hypothetical protein